jgi:hypothetical protein
MNDNTTHSPRPDPEDFYAEGDINSSARGTGARANSGKVSLSLVPLHLLGGVARVFMGGVLKYAAWNWAKGMAWSTSMDCLLRHLFKWWYLGEDIDPDSGEHHLDHVLANALFLRHGVDTYLAGDDRPPTDVAHFDESLHTMFKCFDEEAFLERNPDIRKMVEDRVRQRIQAAMAGLTGKVEFPPVKFEMIEAADDPENKRIRAAISDLAASPTSHCVPRDTDPEGDPDPLASDDMSRSHCKPQGATPRLPISGDPAPEANLSIPPGMRTPRGFDPEGNPD